MAAPKQPRICLECGKEFIPKGSRSYYCYDNHYRPCIVCGKPVLADLPILTGKKNAICSQDCMIAARRNWCSQMTESYLANLSQETRICEACNLPFTPVSANQRFCSRVHTAQCAVCGKVFELPEWKLGQSGKQACSEDCGAKLAHITYQERYSKQTNPEAHAALIAKTEQTNMERHGYKNALDSVGRIASGAARSLKDKYGCNHPMQSDAIRAKRDATNLAKYGTACPLLNEDVKAKTRQTLNQKYGVDNYAKSTEFLKQVITNPQKADKCREFREDPTQFISKYFPNQQPTLAELSDACGIKDSSVGWILDQIGHPDAVRYCYSKMEDEIYNFLVAELGQDSHIQRNTFKIITPYELDIYLPDLKFAIECNPTITHNSTVAGFGKGDKPKPSTYHKMKTDLCEEKGIFLFHIFGYEWTNRSEIIKSMLRNLIRTSPNKIYARCTTVREVSDKDAIDFLNANHRQGGAHSKIRLGLYKENELVSLMTFSKMRRTIGTGNFDSTESYELVRFCNKLNTNVIGGASKLFKEFVSRYNPKEIRSFSDRAHTKGNLYETLGFTYDHTSDPGYMWVDLRTDVGYARNNAQKNNIRAFLHDDAIDLGKTEVQIMSEHNFVQVFDSGVKLWIWERRIR